MSGTSTSARPVKNLRVVKVDDVLDVFLNAEDLSPKILKRMAKDLGSSYELKQTPSNDLRREMQRYRRVVERAVTSFNFYKSNAFVSDYSSDERIEWMYAELQAKGMKLKKKEEAVAEVQMEPEKKRSFLSLCLDQRGNAKVRAACNESQMSSRRWSTCFMIEEALLDERRGVPEATFLVSAYLKLSREGSSGDSLLVRG
ncbi:unnamed protein product [Alternaria sp. RS040]